MKMITVLLFFPNNYGNPLSQKNTRLPVKFNVHLVSFSCKTNLVYDIHDHKRATQNTVLVVVLFKKDMKINITTGTQDTIDKHMVHRNNDQLNIVLFTGLQRVNLLSLV